MAQNSLILFCSFEDWEIIHKHKPTLKKKNSLGNLRACVCVHVNVSECVHLCVGKTSDDYRETARGFELLHFGHSAQRKRDGQLGHSAGALKACIHACRAEEHTCTGHTPRRKRRTYAKKPPQHSDARIRSGNIVCCGSELSLNSANVHTNRGWLLSFVYTLTSI